MNLFDGATLISESSDESFMRLALEQACCAASHDEVPIGAVIVYDNRVIGWGYNLTRRLQDATAHAETVALRQAAQRLREAETHLRSYDQKLESGNRHDCTPNEKTADRLALIHIAGAKYLSFPLK